jgi:50S ribosomal protein L16 3-hydroxylase
MKKHAVLGDITPKEFLAKFWQKKPLLIRQAIPGMQPLLSRDALFALAARDDVESRLLTCFRQQWKLTHGPLATMPPVSKTLWTLLVQGVNLHDDQADQLLQQFRFVPDARLDDLMISYATDGGGVGAHFDSYDVFLLQAQGQRRWRISAQKDLGLREGLPLKLLRDFVPEQEFVLNPGDMLYLPPHYAHEGVAIGECMTYSIGFRAPSWQELGESFLNFMADNIELDGRYADPGLTPTRRPAQIADDMVERIASRLEKLRGNREDIVIFLGEHLSEPKPSVYFDVPARALKAPQFAKSAARVGLRLHRKTRMLYRGKFIFINGESVMPDAGDRKLLQLLADQRELPGSAWDTASEDLRASLHQWHSDGWIVLD